MKQKLSKSNVSSHESNGFQRHRRQTDDRRQTDATRNPHHRMPSIDNIRLGC